MKGIVLALFFLASCTLAWADKPASSKVTGLTGITAISEIGMEPAEKGGKTSVTLPKKWKFIGVSNGYRPNSNNLWFQDTDGSIYLATGFNESQYKFILSDQLQKIIVK